RGVRPVLRQPEASAVDSAGNVYVTDRAQGVIVRLSPEGRVLDPAYVTIARPRLLAIDEQDHLWIGSDGSAEAPYQPGPGEIVRVSPRAFPRSSIEGRWSPRSASGRPTACSWPIATKSRSSSSLGTASAPSSRASPTATCREASGSRRSHPRRDARAARATSSS